MNILEKLSSMKEGIIDPKSAQKAKGIVEEVALLMKDDPNFIESITVFSATMYDMITISNKLGRKPKSIEELVSAAKTLKEDDKELKDVAPALVCSIYTMLKQLQEEGYIRIFPPTERKALKIWDNLKKTKLAK